VNNAVLSCHPELDEGCFDTGSKPLKNSKRIKLWKTDLIEQQNPEWIDLYHTFIKSYRSELYGFFIGVDPVSEHGMTRKLWQACLWRAISAERSGPAKQGYLKIS
jgi:hypothetical protein